jgi:hypothetical protein
VKLVNSSRTGNIAPDAKRIKMIEGRFGDAVRQELGIEPSALSHPEGEYISNFLDADVRFAVVPDKEPA